MFFFKDNRTNDFRTADWKCSCNVMIMLIFKASNHSEGKRPWVSSSTFCSKQG